MASSIKDKLKEIAESHGCCRAKYAVPCLTCDLINMVEAFRRVALMGAVQETAEQREKAVDYVAEKELSRIQAEQKGGKP